MKCKNCGNLIPSESDFCEVCQTPVKQTEDNKIVKLTLKRQLLIIAAIVLFIKIFELFATVIDSMKILIIYQIDNSGIVAYYIISIILGFLFLISLVGLITFNLFEAFNKNFKQSPIYKHVPLIILIVIFSMFFVSFFFNIWTIILFQNGFLNGLYLYLETAAFPLIYLWLYALAIKEDNVYPFNKII